MLFRSLLLLTLCIAISQTRKLPRNSIDEDEAFFDEEDERNAKFNKWFEKLDESENIIDHMLKDVNTIK